MCAKNASLIERLQTQTGLSKTEIVKRAWRNLVSGKTPQVEGGLVALGQGEFGILRDAGRQSANVKQVVRQRLLAKRGGCFAICMVSGQLPLCKADIDQTTGLYWSPAG